MAVRRICGILCVSLAFTGAAIGQVSFLDQEAQVRQVFALLQERLELMQAVAAWKQLHRAPVRDVAREQSVLEASVMQAQQYGISTGPARELFELQLRLAHEMQQRLIDQWCAAGVTPAAPRELSTELRSQLDELGSRLLQAIYLAMPEFQRKDFHVYYAGAAHSLARQGVEEGDISALFDALM